MKRKLLLSVLLALVATARGEQVTNGNFEVFSGGLPVGWTYTRGSDGPATLESSASVSPFTGTYAAGTRSILMTDAPTTASQPSLRNFFPSVSNNFSLSFDFRLAGTLAGDPWIVVPLATSGVVPFNFFIDHGGAFRVTDNFTQKNVINLSPSVWYHVQANGSIPGGKYSGSITPFGGAATAWANYNFISSITEIRGFDIRDDAITATANTPIFFDNFSATTVAVPEPTAPLLLGLAGLAGIHFRRRKSRTAFRAAPVGPR